MTSSSSVLLLTLFSLASVAMAQTKPNFQPIAFSMRSPPALVGPLSTNYALYNAERLHQYKLRGPSAMAFLNGNVYTVTIDGKVVNVATCQPKLVANLRPKICNTFAQCGVLTSIRPDRAVPGALLVLDAFRGVFRVNPINGVAQHLYKNNKKVGGRVPMYLTDFVQASDGTLLIADASGKYDIRSEIYIVLEGRPSGRIFSYDPRNGNINLLVSDVLYYPTGLELTANEDRVLVTEAGRAVIRSIGVVRSNFRNMTVWATNLPGLPASIRRSARGTYWVSLFFTRFQGKPSTMDLYAARPQTRLVTMKQTDPTVLRTFYNRYGMTVEMNARGQYIGSLHDPVGQIMNDVSATAEHEGLLYFASKSRNFVGRIVLPQGDGRVVSVDSAIQVLRSRCQIPEGRLVQAKEVLVTYIKQQTGAGQPGGVPAGLIQNKPGNNAGMPMTPPVSPAGAGVKPAPAAVQPNTLPPTAVPTTQQASEATATAPAQPAQPAAPAATVPFDMAPLPLL